MMNGRDKLYELINNYTYYILIGVLSLLAAFLLPMLGTSISGGFVLPDNPAGWCVLIVTKLLSAVINVMLLFCFVSQGKVNIRENEKYKEACQILGRIKDKKVKLPRAPETYYGQLYGRKGATIFFTSVLSTFALTQAILTFDWVSLLTYGFVVIMGVVFGVMQMKRAEIYWTEEFYEYAKLKEIEEKQNDRTQRESIQEPRGTSPEKSE